MYNTLKVTGTKHLTSIQNSNISKRNLVIQNTAKFQSTAISRKRSENFQSRISQMTLFNFQSTIAQIIMNQKETSDFQ